MLNGIIKLLIVLVESVLLVTQLSKRLIGVHSEQGPRQRQAVLSRYRVPCLFSQKRDLVTEPERFYQIIFSPAFQSFHRRVPVEREEVVIEMLIKSVDFVIDQPVNSERIVFFVHQVKFIANINKLMLHREEATAHH